MHDFVTIGTVIGLLLCLFRIAKMTCNPNPTETTAMGYMAPGEYLRK